MTKFNLKEHIAKNKATFFGSLTEGQFSWMTQDTGQQIGSQDENKIPVYMFDDKGKFWFEKDYDGYGVFGGKDYYELLDQMNGGEGNRSRGIDLAFGKIKTSSSVLFPALVTKPNKFNYKTHDFTKEAEHDPNQSWYDASNEEELEEGKKAGEKIEKKKMKKSELKAKIKEMVLAEMDGPAVEDEQYDFLKEIEDMLNEAEDEEADAEATDDVTADADAAVDTTVDVTTNEVDPNVKAVQDALTQAQAAAQQLGDKKLMNQIGNTITFFTRAHVVEKPKGAVAEGEEYDDYEDDGFDLDAEFANSPNQASFEDVFNVIQSYENDEILDDFTSKFPSMKPVNKEKYRDFVMNYIDDMSEMDYIKANWISIFDEDVYEKAGLA
jgi:hypothetical protein